MSEAGIHFDFYFHLRGAIENDPQRGQRTYARIEPEYTSEDLDGRPDLVLFDTSDDPVLVIEAKRPDGASGREIDPYAPAVIKQAHGYASQLGTPYFATFNGERLVLFNTHEQGVPLLQRSTKSYDIADVEPFADTLLDEIARLEADRISWDSLDDAFIERVRTLHELLAPELENELTAKLDTDDEFRESFVEWATAQGIEYDDASVSQQTEVRERFAEEGAYLLANKVLFYKILEAAPAYSDEVRPLAIRPNHARADLEDYFEEIVANIDFEAVFEHDPIYSEIPLASVGGRLNEFIDELDDQDLTRFDSDVIGRIYEGVIPSERRRELGEYYTPPAICDLITQLTIDDASDRVLDPACGSGGFPVSAYHRKRDLLPEPAGSHERLLSEIHGIDINRFPAHLTAINLAIQDPSSHTENVDVEVSDFFNITPDTQRFGRTQAGAGGEEWVTGNVEDPLGGFDAVVGNPPYIRQQNINNRAQVRDHLSRVDGEHLSKMSDIYSYFITHSTEFLADGGRLGFITSDRWLDTRYGEDLQQFILDNFTVDAVLKFNRQTFEDALVGACIVVLTKEEDSAVRDEHVTKFFRVNESLDIDELTSVVEDDHGPRSDDSERRPPTRHSKATDTVRRSQVERLLQRASDLLRCLRAR
jgi:type I restriction-modification system DNA methylase subunit